MGESPQAWKRYIPFQKHSQAKKTVQFSVWIAVYRHYAGRTASVERTVILSLPTAEHRHKNSIFRYFTKISFPGFRSRQPLKPVSGAWREKDVLFLNLRHSANLFFQPFECNAFTAFLWADFRFFADSHFCVLIQNRKNNFSRSDKSAISSKSAASKYMLFNYSPFYVPISQQNVWKPPRSDNLWKQIAPSMQCGQRKRIPATRYNQGIQIPRAKTYMWENVVW